MIFKGGFEMKTSRTLISSAMLTAMCDTNSIDNLKLLEKFVAMCVAETTDVGSLIDKDKVLKRMDESYSFHDMPMPVLEKILQRMSRGSERSITTSTSNNYAELIRQGVPQGERLFRLNVSAKQMMQSLVGDHRIDELRPYGELPKKENK